LNLSGSGGSTDRFYLGLDYTLVTDDTGKKGKGLGHQLSITPEYDLESAGRIGANIWMEFFDAPQHSDERSDQALQELDWGPYWACDIPALSVSLQVGWLAKHFPRLTSDNRFTNEVYLSLAFDDRKLFGTTEPVFSPFVA
jgi:hypothetical protein